jgi:hypothetical protein
MDRLRPRRSGWIPDPIGALASFVAEAVIVVILGVIALGVAALALWLA